MVGWLEVMKPWELVSTRAHPAHRDCKQSDAESFLAKPGIPSVVQIVHVPSLPKLTVKPLPQSPAETPGW